MKGRGHGRSGENRTRLFLSSYRLVRVPPDAGSSFVKIRRSSYPSFPLGYSIPPEKALNSASGVADAAAEICKIISQASEIALSLRLKESLNVGPRISLESAVVETVCLATAFTLCFAMVALSTRAVCSLSRLQIHVSVYSIV